MIDLLKLGPQKIYRNEYLNEISFPLGGIGSGSIGLTGRGTLRDFEIFNRPNMGSWYKKTYACIRTKIAGAEPVCRVLEGPIQRPYTPADGGGYHSNGEGLPHMDAVDFRGEYPFASLDFKSNKLPVNVQLEAYNPFIPSDVKASSIPCAILHYHVKNPGTQPVHVSLMWSLLNLVGAQSDHIKFNASNPTDGKYMNMFVKESNVQGLMYSNLNFNESDPKFGTVGLLTPNNNVSYTRYWKMVPWFTPQGDLWFHFKQNGKLEERNKEFGIPGSSEAGAICVEEDILPNEEKTFTFYITWFFPNFEKYWGGKSDLGKIWKNYYTKTFSDALDVGIHLAQNEQRYHILSKSFHDALFSSTFPPYVLDAIASNISILKTATTVLLEDGTFYGWEGTNNFEGCCEGTCAHVWNYQQALAFLFPQLERSIHEADFKYNFLFEDIGALEFRTQLPLGTSHGFNRPAADAQMGRLINMYREWKIFGNTEWLKYHWPNVKKAIDFTFEDWDEEKKGVLTNFQHNTYDIDFYGPTMMLTCYYLGALKAGAEMAIAVGDMDSAKEYLRIAAEGEKYCDSKLFNGEYYIQLPPALDKAPINQLGPGCLIDQLVGLEISRLAGIPNFLDNNHVKSALKSIFKYNFKANMREHENYQRLYAVNDEAAVIICSWPHGGRPEVPFPYADEVMNGFEYQYAVHCLLEGYIEEGLTVVKSIRDRYDGYGRNPWDEFECGHHYARSMASYGLVIALSGFDYNKAEGYIGFNPLLSYSLFRSFWSLDNVWGTYEISDNRAELKVSFGEITLKSIRLSKKIIQKEIKVKIELIQLKLTSDEHGCITFPNEIAVSCDHSIKFEF